MFKKPQNLPHDKAERVKFFGFGEETKPISQNDQESLVMAENTLRMFSSSLSDSLEVKKFKGPNMNNGNADLPHLIFLDSHYDQAMWKILSKVTPKLESLGYHSFYDEAPEGNSLEEKMDALKNLQKTYEDMKENMMRMCGSAFIDSVIPYEFTQQYLAAMHLLNFYQQLQSYGINYEAVDMAEVGNESFLEIAVSEDGMIQRNKKMADAYLKAGTSVFGSIGYNHALGVQNEILENFSLEEACGKFQFIYIHSINSVCDYDKEIRQGNSLFPLPIMIFDLNKVEENEVIDSIFKVVNGGSLQSDIIEANSDFSCLTHSTCC